MSTEELSVLFLLLESVTFSSRSLALSLADLRLPFPIFLIEGSVTVEVLFVGGVLFVTGSGVFFLAIASGAWLACFVV